MDDREFIRLARNAGFNEDEIFFLTEYVSRPGHSHTVDQIEDFDDAVTDILDDELE